ncbi:hypothetical protein PMNALOAF_0101 [Methylobacterium adhaesivum]|jgi:hypothetical protein|uniref:DUF1214 domain-containing protein n=1 Tax=Methylobacterium adhaesivum TaxID=333297 RepID=A0ABT8BEZ0_9HYPH|nr:DUF1214 domain-containing protein [Methylobacterium adhaesivum]MDN3589809.1 DUF1214 domain-containing protein [Methylobacterium adhaesivum]GJD28869.1 hypothetical protein PMNALOAF_0101 [Methylobacterium adhaesivum]
MNAADRAAPDRRARADGTPGRVVGAVRRAIRRASTVSLILYTLALGAGIGLATADYATRGGYPFGGVTVGAWTAWPRTGSVGADPYARAVNARRSEIPLAVGEGMLLTAAQDDAGQGLDAACTYAIAGITPPARAWTVTIAGRGPRDPAHPSLREGFTSTEILREPDGRFVITLSPEVQPGNWLPMPRASGPVRLALRLYDTPVAASAGTLDRAALPAITRTGCAA